ncbi:MAG: tRNA-dihydrouridine synthase family protein [Vicinamibacterales bacterium]
MSFAETIAGAVIMAPMTKGSNLPYRRLCVELGARFTMSEMTVARRLRQRRAGEFALIRRFDGEPHFGVQLAGTNPSELAWASALVEARGADWLDLNLGCPIDHFTRKGIGAAAGRQPHRVRRLVGALRSGAGTIPVTAKIRLGWNDDDRNFLEQATAAVEGGADAIVVHGRTRNARYRQAADWDAIGELAAALPVPVIGNGDILGPPDLARARQAGVAAVMVARGALIKPWIFRDLSEGYRDVDGVERLAIYRRYVELATAHWGGDDHGRTRVRTFLRWHLDFWCRYVPRRADGTFPSMQEREPDPLARTPLERLLARADEPALDYLADALLDARPIDPDEVPPPAGPAAREPLEAEG